MNTTIWKYHLDVLDEQLIHVPIRAEILSVACQHEGIIPNLILWAKVDPDAPLMLRLRVHIRGTGHLLTGEEGRFIGTVLMANGSLVWHIFVKLEEIEEEVT